MKKDILWTLGGVVLLFLAVIAVLYTPDGGLQAKISPPPPEEARPAPSRSEAGPAESAERPKQSREARRAPKPPIHWSTAPYATGEDVFALVLQPREVVASQDYAGLESLLGQALPRDIAERTEWIAVYGRSVASELDIARNLTLVIRQTEPTTAVDLAAERFQGRKLTDEMLDDVSYVRVAPATENVLIERVDAAGTYRETETAVEHDALAIVEHDSRTFLIVSEARLPLALGASPAAAPLAKTLGELSRETHCGFVCGDAKGSMLEMLVRAGGDRSAALAKPLLETLRGATHLRATAGLGADHLAQLTLTFASGDESAKTLRQLTGLRDRSRALLDDVASAGNPSSETVAARRLLEMLRFDVRDSNVVVTLPRPTDLRELLGKGQVTSR